MYVWSGVLYFLFGCYKNAIKLTGNFEISGSRQNLTLIKIFLEKGRLRMRSYGKKYSIFLPNFLTTVRIFLLMGNCRYFSSEDWHGSWKPIMIAISKEPADQLPSVISDNYQSGSERVYQLVWWGRYRAMGYLNTQSTFI